MKTQKQIATSDLGLPPNSYIYNVVSASPQTGPYSYSLTTELAVISSDDSLRLLDPRTLKARPDGVLKDVHKSVTCLRRYDEQGNILATAGRDGLVRFWDKRSGKKVMDFASASNQAVSAIECSESRHAVVAGTELEGNGPGDAPMFVWDSRNASTPQLQLLESHTDTVTTLQFHPEHASLLLSGSTDGLVNIFDITQPEEDDALHQVINHRSAIHHAGFLNPSTDVYALGTDETLSFYKLQSPDEEAVEPAPVHLGDVREKWGCEYAVGLTWINAEAYAAVGNHSSQYLDLIPLNRPMSPAEAPLNWTYDLDRRMRLPGAHGEEIVRDVLVDATAHTAFTCGEDGLVKAWKLEGEDEEMADAAEEAAEAKEKRSSKKEDRKKKKNAEKEKKRFKPY